MGDYYWSQYGNYTLHTNHDYFRRNVFFKSVNKALHTDRMKVQNDQRNLADREKRFYQTFGQNDYDGFIKWARNLFTGPDGAVIARFSNEALLQSIIGDIARNAEKHQSVQKAKLTLLIDSEDANKKINEVSKTLSNFEKLSGKSDFKSKDGKIEFEFEANPQIMKAIVNRLKQTQFHISSLNSEALASFIDKEDLGELVFSKDGKQLTNKELSQIIQYRPFPWGYRNSEIREGWKDGQFRPVIEAELTTAIKEIRQNIISMGSDGSPQMQQALRQTLDDTLPLPFDPEEHYNIFFVGANYRNGLLGAFGEFGTALLINYLKLVGAGVSEKRAKIMGQDLGKRDVEYAGLGVQVKNYSLAQSDAGTYTRKKIEVNQHPNQLADYFSDRDSFLGFITNYHFNENIQKSASGNPRQTMNMVIDKLQDKYLAELLRIAVDDVNDDKVKDIVNSISAYKTSIEAKEEFKCNLSKDIFEECYSAYENYKRKENLLDFDDLSINALKLLKNNGDVLRKYS